MAASETTTRAKSAVIVAALLCAWGAVEALIWEKTWQTANHDPYMLQAQDVRLTQIRETVPENAVMGYITDLDPGSTSDSAAFNTALYTLAPRLIQRDTSHKWVLGMLSKQDDELKFVREKGFTVVLGFQNGAVLFRNEGAK